MDGKQREQLELLKKRLPHYMSNEKAKELKIEDWGTPEDVEKMAKVSQTNKDVPEIKKVLEKLVEKRLTSKTGDWATLSKTSIDEMLWDDKIKKSIDTDSHLLAAENIERLYPNAIKKWDFELDPDKKNQGLKDRKYLYSPMKYKDSIIPVKFTVKEFKNENEGNRLYCLTTLPHKIEKGNAASLAAGEIENSTTLTSRLHSPDPNIPQSTQKVKEGNDV